MYQNRLDLPSFVFVIEPLVKKIIKYFYSPLAFNWLIYNYIFYFVFFFC